MNVKEIVGKEIAKLVTDGDIIGVGTGTTVDAALQAIHQRIQTEKLNVKIVPSSIQSAWRCQEIGLNVLYSGFKGDLSWGFDGADEVDSKLRLIKGKGGAMLQEKILAAKCSTYIVIVDESKLVSRLGEKFSVPIEVIPEALSVVEHSLGQFNPQEISLRSAKAKHGPVLTEAGNIILDVKFADIPDSLEKDLKSIVGVVETGLFLNYAMKVLVSHDDGTIKTMEV